MYVGVFMTMYATPSVVETSIEEEISSNLDLAEQIKVVSQREKKVGNQLFILGEIKNTGATKVGSINLEAELFDDNGEFEYECSEYGDKDLMPCESENYQIVCGYGKNPIPDYRRLIVKVASASSF